MINTGLGFSLNERDSFFDNSEKCAECDTGMQKQATVREVATDDYIMTRNCVT